MSKPKFGEQRLALREVSAPERLLFQTMGVVDPAHYLHSLYFRQALAKWKDFYPRAILDAGCGRGDYSFYLARLFPDAQVYAVDIDQARVERNRRVAARLGLDNVSFQVADLVTAKFPVDFDLIISIDVLEHIADQEQALRNLSGQLSAEGRVFFHIPTTRERPVPFSRALVGFHEWAEKEHVAEDRSAADFLELMRRTGYSVSRSHRTFGYYTGELATSLFNLPYQSTLRNKVLQAMLSPICRVLALADVLGLERTRYALATEAHRMNP
ncbi:MAG: class I SAM-dependent methyltransferase [Gemmatimonadaceae bacterium]